MIMSNILRRKLIHATAAQTTRNVFQIQSFSSTLSCRHSSHNSLVNLDLKQIDGIGILTMNRPPANTLSLEMLKALSDAVKTAEADVSIQALIVASSSPRIFCAGLDLDEIYKPKTDRIQSFWDSFQQLYLDLYGSRLSTVAAIGGHAPAAGCMIALSCDVRLMLSTAGKIGLNESLLGIVAPPWLGQQYIDTIGHRNAELALSLGTLFNPDEALNIGLIDKIVPKNEESVLNAAIEEARRWIEIPPEARKGAKELTRFQHLEHLKETRKEDNEKFCSFVMRDSVQESLGRYVEQLRKK